MESIKEKLNSLYRGYYCPSFFKLLVNTNKDLGNLNVSIRLTTYPDISD